jgi:hypothetical protein
MAKTRRSRGLISRVYSPLHHLFQASEDTVGVVTNTARNIVKRSIKAVNNVGSSLSRHANMTIKNVTGKRKQQRKQQRKNATRKQQRKQQRKH